MEQGAGIDALFLYATEGILVVNESGDIVRANPSAEKLFGYRKGQLNGRKVEQLVPRRVAGKHVKHRSKYNADPHARSMGSDLELFGLKKDNTEFPVEISLSPYRTDEGQFVIAFIIDITARKQAEENLRNYSADLQKQVKKRTLVLEEAIKELEKTKAELHASLEKERELNELKSRFVSMASHEFRTPLATILSSASLVSRYNELGDQVSQQKHIGKIKNSIQDLTNILNDFLSLSKLEEGKIEAIPKKLKIREFVNDAITEIEPLKKDGQVISYQHSGSNTAKMDPKLFKNVLYNLLSNAIKFSHENSKIEVSTQIKEQLLSLKVKDNGIGMSEEDQKHLFERFFRGHNATHIQGTGLGLNIVMRYVELMNGKLKFTSRENQGTVFQLTFPQHSRP